MNQYYECHVTMTGDMAAAHARTNVLGWKFSQIDGDPNLGDGVKMYATRQFKGTMDKNEVLGLLKDAADFLEDDLVAVLRRKVELVIFDDRSSKVTFECTGGCPECHSDDL